MKVHFDLGELPSFRKCVITIGTFDGVHKGHQKIIAAIKKTAAETGGESVLITFHPHPRKIVSPNLSLQLINTLEEKIQLLSQYSIDHLVVVPFTTAFANLSAEEYIADFLIDKFHPQTIVIGYDHHFGKGRHGNYKLLEDKAAQYQYNLIEIPKHVLHEIDISSTQIRKAILASDIETANDLLGYPFFFSGTVVDGDKLGRQLGYPTANLVYTNNDKIRLGHGVYACFVNVNGQIKKGMLSIGNRPTIDGIAEKVEVNIFDFDAEIYGAVITVTVKNYLRRQEKYNSLDELIAQLGMDKLKSLEVL